MTHDTAKIANYSVYRGLGNNDGYLRITKAHLELMAQAS